MCFFYLLQAFASHPGLVTMEAIDPKYTNIMGTSKTLSTSDLATVNTMYQCSIMHHAPAKPAFKSPGVAGTAKTAVAGTAMKLSPAPTASLVPAKKVLTTGTSKPLSSISVAKSAPKAAPAALLQSHVGQ